MDLLQSPRDHVGVVPAKFMFPLVISEGQFRGCETCGAKKPTYLISTGLWKHIGTVSQAMNLKDLKLDILARLAKESNNYRWLSCEGFLLFATQWSH